MKAAIYTRTLEACKLALRRFAILLLRKLVDASDYRLHAAEVKLRKDLSNGQSCQELVNAEHVATVRSGRYANAPGAAARSESADLAPRSRLGNPACPVRETIQKAASPSAVKMAANLKVSGMSIADASSAMRNLGFSAKEVSAVFS
jgi:hypothetical protein